MARAAGLRFVGIGGGKFRRLPGAGLWRNLLQIDNLIFNLRDLVLIAVGTGQALWVLARFRPDAVFNKAGTVGLPVGVAAWLLRIPMVIHEPDLTPGLENRLLGHWAAAIAVGFAPNHYRRFPAAKLRYTGNPIQPAILTAQADRAHDRFGLNAKRPLVVVVGGSQGAVRVNDAIIAIAPELTALAQVVHVSGVGDYQRLRDQTQRLAAASYHLVPQLPIDELGDAYQAATVVVARAGANTIAELAVLRKPTILLPNHQAAAHQVANAAIVGDAGAAIVVPDEQPAPLLVAIRKLLASTPKREALAAAIADFGQAEAANNLADVITGVARPTRPAAARPGRRSRP